MTFCRCRCFGGCNFWKEISSKSKIWYPMNLFDIWIPQTATCQKLEAKLLRYVFANHEIAYWKHVLHWNRKEMKNENPGILKKVISFAWSLLYFFEKCTENENFQIFKFTVFAIFFSSKAWNLPKTLQIIFFVLYDITYIQNTGNDNTYLNLPLN